MAPFIGIGNKVGKIAFSWAAYFASLISATVEQAAPTHVVLTFPYAKSLVATDFTIAGFTVNSASWTGAVLTLVLAETVVFEDVLVVTFVVTGGTAVVTNNAESDRFITTWNTELAGSATKTIVVPTTGAGYDCWIDWGDGGAEENKVGTPGNITHLYATTGIKTVKIRGLFPRIYFNNLGDKKKLLAIAQWGIGAWSSMANAFFGCTNLTGTYSDIPNTTNVTDMSGMFYECYSFNSAVNLNTANVTTMANMFRNCLVFNQSVSNFNTAKVTSMIYMFYVCSKFNQSVSNFNTANVTNMAYMFYACAVFNQSLASFNTAKVISMAAMFLNCVYFNQDISGFNVELVTNMNSMFSGSNSLSRTNYDLLLISWAAQAVKPNIALHAGDAVYSVGAATTARGVLTGGTNLWTITDGGQSFDNGKVVFTFDDGGAPAYSVVYPMFVDKGAKGTFYIISDFVGTANFVTWAELQTMNTGGMDLQGHTKDHPDLTTLNQAQVVAQLQGVNDAFTANSLPVPLHMAYPYTAYNDNVKSWVDGSGLRYTARAGIEYLYVTKASDKFVLCGPFMTAVITVSHIKSYMDVALSEHKALIITIHGVGPAEVVTAAMLEEVIDYAQSIGIDILSIAELYALM